MQMRTRCGERMPGGAVAGVLDGCAVTLGQQYLRAQRDALLGTAGDDDLPGVAVQAAGTAQVGGDQFAQALLAGRVAVAQAVQRRIAPEARLQTRPGIEGKEIEAGTPTRKARGAPVGGSGR